MKEQVGKWIDRVIAPETGYLKSFWFPPEEETCLRERVTSREEWAQIKFGANACDVAHGVLVLLAAGRIDKIEPVIRAWSTGRLGELELRAYWAGELDSGHPYMYGETCVPGRTCGKNIDYYLFQSTRADGVYLFGSHHGPTLPRFWVDWYPMSRENAWVALACLHLYGKLFGTRLAARALEIADRAARGALLLQADTGGIRMSTMGTWSHPEARRWFDLTSTEASIAWYAVFGGLLQATGNKQYADGMKRLQSYFVERAFDAGAGIFHEALQFRDGTWTPITTFSSQCQIWAIIALGAHRLQEWFHDDGLCARLWQTTRERSGVLHAGALAGLDFTDWRGNSDCHGRGPIVSYERSGAGVLAALSAGAECDARDLRRACAAAVHETGPGELAWPYADGTGACSSRATGLGWNAVGAEALNLAASAWMTYVLDEQEPFNPFLVSIKTQTR